MATVTFDCRCPQAVVEVRVQAEGQEEVEVLVFESSGSKGLDLESGLHFVGCRAEGTPGTEMSLAVTKGGAMEPFDETLDGNGEAGGNRDLTVA